MNTPLIIKKNHLSLFNFFEKIQEDPFHSLQTFLFYGNPLSGKETVSTTLLQMLNCPDFNKNFHEVLHCKICSKINALKEEYGILNILTHVNLDFVKEFYHEKIKNPELDPFTQISFLHLIHKLLLILEQQNIKQIKSATKTLTQSKLESLNTMLENLKKEVAANIALTIKEKDFLELLSTLESLFYNISIGYVNHILEKLSYKNSSFPFRFLIINDPVFLSETILNRLLKIIEEPPAGTFIFFITSKPKKLLLTIKSRCVGFHFKPFSKDYIQNLKQQFPNFPVISLLQKKIKEITTLNENSSIHEIISFLEKTKAPLYTLSPVDKERRNMINDLLLGLKEYSLNKNHLREVSLILNKRLKK